MRVAPAGARRARRPRLRDLIGAVLVALAAVLIHAGALARGFGFLDDYPILLRATSQDLWDIVGGTQVLAGGRPLQAVLTAALFAPVESIEGLRWLRMLTVAGIAAVAVGAYGWLRMRRFSVPAAAGGATVVAALPAFQVYSAWAVTAIYPFAILTAACGAVMARRLRRPGPSRRRRAAEGAGAAGLLLVALLTYQPAAMAFVALLVLDLLADAPAPGPALRRLADGATVFAAAAVPAYALARLAPGHGSRAEPVDDIPAKARWYLDEAVPNALDPVGVPGSGAVAVLVLGVVALGMAVHLRLAGPGRMWLLALVPAGLVGAYIPNLVTRDNWAAYRSLVAVSLLGAGLALLGLRALWRSVRTDDAGRPARRPVAAAGAAVLVAAAVLLGLGAHRNVSDHLVAPQVEEVAAMRALVDARLEAGADHLVVARPRWHEVLGDVIAYDEFGQTAAPVPWALGSLLRLIASERAPGDPPAVHVVECTPWEVPFRPGVTPIELRVVLAPRRNYARICAPVPVAG